MQVLTTDELSPRQHLTPEGYLLCLEVPVARVGEMLYAPGEVPVGPGKDGLIRVDRTAEELFRDETLQSLVAKAVIDEHPEAGTLVTPENCKKLSRGVVLNPRRGTGDNDDVIVCDLMLTDKELIRKRQEGKVEVSAGYEADYEDTGNGTGFQTNIIFNHVALVDRGRCGPRCAIGDHQPTPNSPDKELPMATTTTKKPVRKTSFFDRLRALVADAEAEAGMTTQQTTSDPTIMTDEGLVTDGPAETDSLGGGTATHVHVHLDGGSGGYAKPAAATTDDGEAAPGAGEEGAADPVEARFVALETGMGELKNMLGELLKLQQADLAAEGGEEGEASTTQDEEGAEDGATQDGAAEPFAEAYPDASKRAPTGDSASLARSYPQARADAAILVPGFRMTTIDAAAKRAVTIDAMCAARRRALDACAVTEDGAVLLSAVSGSANVNPAKLDCKAVATMFSAAAAAKKLMNNRASVGDASSVPKEFRDPNAVRLDNTVGAFDSPDQLNKFYREHYGQ